MTLISSDVENAKKSPAAPGFKSAAEGLILQGPSAGEERC